MSLGVSGVYVICPGTSLSGVTGGLFHGVEAAVLASSSSETGDFSKEFLEDWKTLLKLVMIFPLVWNAERVDIFGVLGGEKMLLLLDEVFLLVGLEERSPSLTLLMDCVVWRCCFMTQAYVLGRGMVGVARRTGVMWLSKGMDVFRLVLNEWTSTQLNGDKGQRSISS